MCRDHHTEILNDLTLECALRVCSLVGYRSMFWRRRQARCCLSPPPPPQARFSAAHSLAHRNPNPPSLPLLTPKSRSHPTLCRDLRVTTGRVRAAHACGDVSRNSVVAVPVPCWDHQTVFGGWPARVQDSTGTSLLPVPNSGS